MPRDGAKNDRTGTARRSTNFSAPGLVRPGAEGYSAARAGDRDTKKKGIGLEQSEVDLWQDIITKMRVVFHGDGMLSQFEGYDRLLEFDWRAAGNESRASGQSLRAQAGGIVDY